MSGKPEHAATPTASHSVLASRTAAPSLAIPCNDNIITAKLGEVRGAFMYAKHRDKLEGQDEDGRPDGTGLHGKDARNRHSASESGQTWCSTTSNVVLSPLQNQGVTRTPPQPSNPRPDCPRSLSARSPSIWLEDVTYMAVHKRIVEAGRLDGRAISLVM
jgi:hypothetical protein